MTWQNWLQQVFTSRITRQRRAHARRSRTPLLQLAPVTERLEDRIVLASDWGDAPNSYATLNASSGPEHVSTTLFLGAAISTEADGQPDAAASADTFDDGITFTSQIIANGQMNITATVSGGPGNLDAWIDWSRDGDFGDAGEQILASQGVATGSNTFTINVPAAAAVGANTNTFARFRLSTAGGLSSTGAAVDGEVEDYQITLNPAPSTVYVDDSWVGTTVGATPGTSSPGGLIYGANAFSDVQSAINVVAAGGTVVIYGGTYAGTVDVNKTGLALQTSINSFVPADTAVALIAGWTLTEDTIITMVDADLTFGTTIDADVAGGASLTVNDSGTANVSTFSGGGIGGSFALSSLTTDAAGTTILQLATINTTGTMAFNDAVTLNLNGTYTSSAGGITFGSTVNGSRFLNLSAASGTVNFNGAVGGSTALTSITVTAATTTHFGSSVTTSGVQNITSTTIEINGTHATTNAAITFTGNVTLQNNVIFNPGSGATTITGTTNGGFSLTKSAGTGSIDLQGAVGGTSPLTSILVSNNTTTARFGNSVTTSGSQLVTATTIQINGTHATTNAAITFTGNVTLQNNVIFNPGSGATTITGTTDGGFSLTKSAGTGSIDLQGAVGGTSPLTSILVSNNTTTARFGSSVTTSGSQLVTATTIQINGTHATTNAAITFTGNVTLQNNVIFNPGSGATTITGTTDGGFSLTKSAGTGNIDLQGAVGGTTPLTSILVSNTTTTARFGGSVTTTGSQLVTATTIQINGTHATNNAAITFTGNVTLQNNVIFNAGSGATTITGTTDGGFSLTKSAGTGNINLQGAVGGTNPLTSILVSNNTTTARFGSNVTTTGSQLVTATTIQTNGTHTTSASAITFTGNVTLQNNTALTNGSSATGDITVTGTVNGLFSLQVTAGTANVNFNSAIGATNALTQLVIVSSNTTRFGSTVRTSGFQDITASTLQTNGTFTSTTSYIIIVAPTITLQANTAFVSGAGAGDNVTLQGDVNGPFTFSITAGVGAVSVQGNVGNSIPVVSSVTVVSSGSIGFTGNVTSNGAQSYTSSGTITTQSTYTTSNAAITFAGAVSLNLATTVTNSSGAAGNITFSSTVNGNRALNITAGTSDVAFNSSVGATTALQSITINSARNVNFASTIRTTSDVTQTNGTGTTTLRGTSGTGIGGNLNLRNNNITLAAGTTTVVGQTTFRANTSGVTASAGALVSPTLQLLGLGTYTMTNTGNDVDTFAADIGGSIDYRDADTLSIGTVTTSGLNSGTGVATGGDIQVILTTGTLNVDQVVSTLAGAGGTVTIGSGVSLNTPNALTPGAGDITLRSNDPNGDIVINQPQSFDFDIILQANRDIIVADTLQTINNHFIVLEADFNDDGVGGVWVQSAGFVDSAASLDISGADIFDATTGNADPDSVFISSDGTSVQIQSATTLTIGYTAATPGGADVIISGVVESGTDLDITALDELSQGGTATISAVNGDITLSADDWTIADSGSASAELEVFTTHTITASISTLTTFGADVLVQSAGGAIIINTDDLDLDTSAAPAVLTATSAGILTIRNSSLNQTIDLGTTTPGSLSIDDAEIDQMTAGILRIGRTGGQQSGAVTISAAITVDPLVVPIVHILTGSTVDDNGTGSIVAQDLAIEAGDDVTLYSTGNDVDTLAINSVNGDIFFRDIDGFIIDTVDGIGSTIPATGTGTPGTGTLTLAAGDAVTQNIAITAGNLVLLDIGPFTLDMATNDVNTIAANTTGAISYTDANTVTVSSITTTNPAITTDGITATSLLMSAPTINVNRPIQTTVELGYVVFNVTTALNIAAAGDITALGAVSQIGSGLVSTAGDITTSNDSISFASQVTLTGNVQLSTDLNYPTLPLGAGDITFSGVLRGNSDLGQNLTLIAGTGNISFVGQVGPATRRLGDVTINSASNVTESAGFASNSFTQLTGTGATTFNAFMQTVGTAGISISTNGIAINAPMSTTNTGPVTLTNAQSLIIASGAGAINADGAVLQNGAGQVKLGGNITTTNDNVTFNATVSQTRNITISAGAGNVAFNGLTAIGAYTLTISSTNVTNFGPTTTFSAGTITAASGILIGSGEQFTGTGTINGPVTVQAGSFTPGINTAGRITVNGNLNLGTANTVFDPELRGTSAGTTYDQVRVTGAASTIDVSNAILNVTRLASFTPTVGSSYTIIDNQSANPITGTFTGFPLVSNNFFYVNGSYFSLAYNGGTGNDVVITRLASPVTTTIIDDGDANFSLTTASGGNWSLNTTVNVGYLNDLRFSLPGQGDTATWTFSGLTPGNYRVAATWRTHTNRATNSPFTLTSGGNTSTLTVNQRIDPNDFTASGKPWEYLSQSFTVDASGTLTVVLSDTGATTVDGYVIADAIRIESLTNAEPEVQVLDGTTDIVDGTGIVNLGTLAVGVPVTRTFTINNIGFSNLIVGNNRNTPSSGFSVTNIANVISSGGSTTFDVTFTPTTTGAFSTPISFTNNDSSENSFDFTVKATVSASTQVIDDSSTSGFSTIGTWSNNTVANVGFNNALLFAAPNVSTGVDVATWSFTGLTPGMYQVSATWRAHSNRATNATFAVTGDAPETVPTINQQSAPSSFLDQGVYWDDLVSTMTITGSTITVTLDAGGADGYVVADAIRLQYLGPLMAVGGQGSNPAATSITQAQLNTMAQVAITRWTSAARLTTAQQNLLKSTQFVISDLASGYLGAAAANRIYIDVNAAGYGWFVDSTPTSDTEFVRTTVASELKATTGVAAGKIDLLTVLLHELGHKMGLRDLDEGVSPGHLMTNRLGTGTRRLPIAASSLDAVFAAMPKP